MNKKVLLYQAIIAGISTLLFIPFIGKIHLFDWDELNFAESAREMILTGDYLNVRINFEPFWEKPPLFIWMQVVSMKLFGINEFAARFPNAICGIVTLLILFNLGNRLYNNRFAFLWTLAYAGSILPFFYFKSGIIDPWFNLFTFLSVIFWIYAIDAKTDNKKYLYCFLSASFLGLAMLSKGPVSVLIFGILALILFIFNGFRLSLNWKQLGLFAISFIVIGGLWFILQIISGNFDIIKDFIIYQIRLFRTKDAGHGGFPFYHFIILLFGVFPASVFAIQGHKYIGPGNIKKTLHIAMIALLWIVLLIFSVVKTKIVHYSSMTYFPITYLAAYSCYNIINEKIRFRLWQKMLLMIIGGILSTAIILLPVIYTNRNILIEKGFITNPFIIGNLQAETGWNLYQSLIGIALLAGMIISLALFQKKKTVSLVILYSSSMLFILFSMIFIAKGAEKISQNGAIEFIQEKAGNDVYMKSFHKSYAVLFYGQQKIPVDKKVFNIQWLANGNIDKDAYFIGRIHKKEAIQKKYPELQFLYEKNGYVFFLRKAVE